MNLTKNIEISDKMYAKLHDCVKQLVSADIDKKIQKIAITGGFVENGSNLYQLLDDFLYLTIFVEDLSDLDDSMVPDIIIDYQKEKTTDIHVVIDMSPMEDIVNDEMSYIVWDDEMRGE